MTSASSADPAHLYYLAVDALNRSEWAQAFALAQRVLPMAPSHAGVHFVAGVAALHQQQIPLALRHLQQSVRLNPSRADYGAQWARALAAAGAIRQSVEAADAAAAIPTEDAMTLDSLGVIYSQANAHAKAAEMFRRAAEFRPEVASFRFNRATSLTFTGDAAAAELEYEACLAREPRYWKAHLALAQLRRQSPEKNHVERLRSLLAQHAHDLNGQMYLHLALSKEYEDLGELDESFAHLTAGKRAGRGKRGYSSERDASLFKSIEANTRELHGPEGSDSGEPIFVIGMPRSGTTLVDRILSSHPDVQSAGELQNFSIALKRASGSRTPNLLDEDTLGRARELDWRQLGAAYVGGTRPVTGHTPRFVDKLPHNFLYAGHIARALPNARIICLRRNPMDTCLSNFRQLFAQSSPFYDYSFDLLDTGRYYVMFDRLMAHWKRVMPERILEIEYEAIVDDQEQTTRRLLEFCGLSWNEACLRFDQNEAPVSTASAVQVRQPLYRSALQRWKRYERQLAGLRSLLEEAGIAV